MIYIEAKFLNGISLYLYEEKNKVYLKNGILELNEIIFELFHKASDFQGMFKVDCF